MSSNQLLSKFALPEFPSLLLQDKQINTPETSKYTLAIEEQEKSQLRVRSYEDLIPAKKENVCNGGQVLVTQKWRLELSTVQDLRKHASLHKIRNTNKYVL